MKVENLMEIPPQFRTRKPPRRELYSKLLILFLFGVFCAVVSVNVAPLPLPEPAGQKGSETDQPNGDVEVATFSTLSPEERVKLAEVGARLSVPYLTPWGEDERPALFFMWHRLYRSIKPDVERYKALLHNTTVTTPQISTTTAPALSPVDKVQLVIDVVETEQGYITASLARFFPETLVFSVVVNSTVERRPFAPRTPDRNAPAGTGRVVATISPEKQAYAEAVAAKVERVVSNPEAENVQERLQLPGMNHLPPSTEAPAAVVTTTEANANGEDEAAMATALPLAASPRLFLCVPATVFNGSYYTDPETSALSVNYQVLLAPYIALRSAQSMADFDAMLRAMLTRANVASFIVLPWLWQDTDGGEDDAGGNGNEGANNNGEVAQPQRAQLYARELYDFDRWYGENEGYPLRVLERAMRVPEVLSRYQLSILPLGVKRWAGALRELFRVELTPLPESLVANTTTTTTAAPSTTTAPVETVVADDITQEAIATSPPTTATSAAKFGCAARSSFLQCATRAHHASCNRFSDGLLE